MFIIIVHGAPITYVCPVIICNLQINRTGNMKYTALMSLDYVISNNGKNSNNNNRYSHINNVLYSLVPIMTKPVNKN